MKWKWIVFHVWSLNLAMQAIKAKITSLRYGDLEVDIQYVDVQESLNGGIQVLVTGYLTGKDNVSHAFSQALFLALQVKGGYFILNDMFRYMDNDTNTNTNYYHEGDQGN